jgi:hypothetical protein
VPGKASGGERLSAGVIDPGAVIGVEPDILMLVVIAAVDLVGAPDIDHGLRASLIIYAAIQDERLVGPFCERVGIDEGLRPGRLETWDQGFRLLE